MGSLQTILEYVAGLSPDGEAGARARSGDIEVQVQEKANGEKEIVVLERLAYIDMKAFHPEDTDDE